VDNPSLIHAMESAQHDLVKTDPSFAEFLVSVKKAHITLLVFRVEDEQMEKARIIFDTVIKEKYLMFSSKVLGNLKNRLCS
jgi:hypothetical protein